MTREDIRAQLGHRDALICTLYGEAAGESLAGQIAVGCAIRNRVHADLHNDGKPDWWGEGYRDVCLAKWQFSCWWEDAPNTDRVYALAQALIQGTPLTSRALVDQLAWVADGLMDERVRDQVDGSTHYVTAALLKAAPPKWAIGRAPRVTVGHHVFFAGVEV